MRTDINQATWDLIHAQGRMLDKWADGDDSVKQGLWKDLHDKGNKLRELLPPSESSPSLTQGGTIQASENNNVSHSMVICPHSGQACYDDLCGKTTNICNNSHCFSKETILNDADPKVIKIFEEQLLSANAKIQELETDIDAWKSAIIDRDKRIEELEAENKKVRNEAIQECIEAAKNLDYFYDEGDRYNIIEKLKNL